MDDPTERGRRGDQENEKRQRTASLTDCPRGHLVDATVGEHIKRHRRQFAERMDEAHQALLKGKAAMLAHALGISEQGVQRLGGVTDSRDAAPRDAQGNLKSDEAV